MIRAIINGRRSFMADPNNPGQFGNREDTEEQARKGGENSSGQFGAENGADPKEAGAAGAAAQPREAKVEGGKKGGASSGGQNDE
jgi:general stress protein YciG